MSRKAQFFSTDLVFSFVLFVLFFSGYYFAWDYSENMISSAYETKKMETRSVQASDVLVRTSGSPENWDNANVVSLGIAIKNSKKI